MTHKALVEALSRILAQWEDGNKSAQDVCDEMADLLDEEGIK